MTVRLKFIRPNRKPTTVDIRMADDLPITNPCFRQLFEMEQALNSLPGTNTRVHITIEE